jgi:hypothetical protein
MMHHFDHYHSLANLAITQIPLHTRLPGYQGLHSAHQSGPAVKAHEGCQCAGHHQSLDFADVLNPFQALFVSCFHRLQNHYPSHL